jgi:hypothetical protein
VIAADHTAEIHFTNEKEDDDETSLTVTKVIEGNPPAGEANREFSFVLEIAGRAPEHFTLAAGETIHFDHLPVDAAYTIRELSPLPDNYALTGVAIGAGTLDVTEINAVFTNTYVAPDTTSVTVTKV